LRHINCQIVETVFARAGYCPAEDVSALYQVAYS